MSIENIKKGLLLDNYHLQVLNAKSPSKQAQMHAMRVTPVTDSIYKILFIFLTSISDKKINWLSLLLNLKFYRAILGLINNLKDYYQDKSKKEKSSFI